MEAGDGIRDRLSCTSSRAPGNLQVAVTAERLEEKPMPGILRVVSSNLSIASFSLVISNLGIFFLAFTGLSTLLRGLAVYSMYSKIDCRHLEAAGGAAGQVGPAIDL